MKYLVRKKLKKFSILAYFAFVFFIAFLMPKFLSFVLSTRYPVAVITSQSMWPILQRGDLVIISGLSDNDIATGQIVVYSSEKGLIIHRVKKLTGNLIIAKGDANTSEDAPVNKNQVVGKLITFGNMPLKIPYLGNISLLLGKERN